MISMMRIVLLFLQEAASNTPTDYVMQNYMKVANYNKKLQLITLTYLDRERISLSAFQNLRLKASDCSASLPIAHRKDDPKICKLRKLQGIELMNYIWYLEFKVTYES